MIINHKDANIVYQADQNRRWRRNDNAEQSTLNTVAWTVSSQVHAQGTLNRKQPQHLYSARQVANKMEIYRSLSGDGIGQIISQFASNIEVNHPTLQNAEQFWWMRASPVNFDHLYVGLQNWDWQQRIYRNTNVDDPNVATVVDAWEEVPHPRRAPLYSLDEDREAPVMGIAFDTDDDTIIYIAYGSSGFNPGDYDGPFASKMVYRLDVSDLSVYPANNKFDCDGSLPCKDLTMNLPNSFMDRNCLAFEQGSDGGLYVAMHSGVYFTNNKRIAAYDPEHPEDAEDLSNISGWVRLGGGLPHVKPRGLEINYQVNRIRVGTTGRGVWEHALQCPPDETIEESGTYASDTFAESRMSITSDAIVPQGVKVDYRAGESVRLVPGFQAQPGSRFHAFIHPCDLPGNSFNPKGLPSAEVAAADFLDRDPVLQLELFPNPASDMLTIRCPSITSDAPGELRIFDSSGRLVVRRPMSGSQLSLDVAGLAGLYVVLLEHDGRFVAGRVVIH